MPESRSGDSLDKFNRLVEREGQNCEFTIWWEAGAHVRLPWNCTVRFRGGEFGDGRGRTMAEAIEEAQ